MEAETETEASIQDGNGNSFTFSGGKQTKRNETLNVERFRLLANVDADDVRRQRQRQRQRQRTARLGQAQTEDRRLKPRIVIELYQNDRQRWPHLRTQLGAGAVIVPSKRAATTTTKRSYKQSPPTIWQRQRDKRLLGMQISSSSSSQREEATVNVAFACCGQEQKEQEQEWSKGKQLAVAESESESESELEYEMPKVKPLAAAGFVLLAKALVASGQRDSGHWSADSTVGVHLSFCSSGSCEPVNFAL
ncbi:hypothetical protein ACLKA7_008668 [Drosophila subpalustris]